MNLLELQVLAVVSRIPDGNDGPLSEFREETEERRHRFAEASDGAAAPRRAADETGVSVTA